MLTHRSDATPVEMLPGVTRRTLNSGKRMMLIEVTFEEGAVVPFHSHPHEQIGYLASGRLQFEIAGLRQELAAGDSWLVPSHVPHQVTALEPSVAIDVFSPPREEYR
ncbi:MAG: cupin domain-containing protein [Chloroflexota bacterium]|nr:cupin domain-containing protein [Chloroflexota bacterium]